MLNDVSLLLILASLLLINLLSFLIILLDKMRSGRPGAERISEGILFFLASAFGSLGIYAGMFIFRHKTHKWYFLVGIPLLIIQNAASAYLLYLYLLTK